MAVAIVSDYIVSTSHKIGAGVECEVFDVGNSICYKRYRDGASGTMERIESIYKAASITAAHGLGPRVYERTDGGYFTQIVTTWEDYKDAHGCSRCNAECSHCPFNLERIQELRCKLREFIYADFCDIHLHNVGLKDGHLVCIDFGIGVVSY
jgi:hypothetical protein